LPKLLQHLYTPFEALRIPHWEFHLAHLYFIAICFLISQFHLTLKLSKQQQQSLLTRTFLDKTKIDDNFDIEQMTKSYSLNQVPKKLEEHTFGPFSIILILGRMVLLPCSENPTCTRNHPSTLVGFDHISGFHLPAASIPGHFLERGERNIENHHNV
jgi:hypothetical protein